MNPRKNYTLIQTDEGVRMIDARLLRLLGPLVGPALAVAEIPAVERCLCRIESAFFRVWERLLSLLKRRPRSFAEARELAEGLLGHFRGRPTETPALIALLMAVLFLAEFSAMALDRHLRVPDYPQTSPFAVREQTLLDRALLHEIGSLYAAGVGHEPLRAKLVPPLPAFIETEPCFAPRASSLLKIRWPAVKLAVTAEVRRAVERSAMRMPVDDDAFHPLDKESILRAAGDRLRPVLAMVTAAPPPSPASTETVVDQSPAGPRKPETAASAPAPHNGRLSALFESGDKGVYAIGYDPKGGTSYGKYQFSSRKGSLTMFLDFLDRHAPQWADILRRAGKANSGYVGGPVARQWKMIAARNPIRFEYLQDLFVHEAYYLPALKEVTARTGVDVSRRHGALRELLWSTAVQHGPSGGADIFVRAARKASSADGGKFNKALVEEIFRERELKIRRMPHHVKPGVKRRLKQEKSMALTMLDRPELSYEIHRNL